MFGVSRIVASFAEVASGELKEHVVQAGPLDGDVLRMDGEGQQVAQALGRVAIAERRHDELAIRLLQLAETFAKARPPLGLRAGEIAFEDKQAIAAEPFLELPQRALGRSMMPIRWHNCSASSR